MKVSLIIVHYRAGRLCVQAVDSFREAARAAGVAAANLDIVVVDNGHRPEDVEHLLTLDGRVVVAAENLGYARGLNLGVRQSDADVVVLSNPDVVFQVGAVAALLDALRAGADIAGPRTYWDWPSRTMHPPLAPRGWLSEASRSLARLRDGWAASARRAYRRHAFRHWTAEAPIASYSLPGSVLAMWRHAFARVGGFDPRFPLYFEDDAFLAEAQRCGLLCLHVPNAGVLHHLNRSAAIEPEAAAWFEQSQRLMRRLQHGELGARLLDRLDALPRPRRSPDVATEPPTLHLDGLPASAGPFWLELSRAPIGVPAVASRIPDGTDAATLPSSCFRHCPPGDYWLRAVDESGREWRSLAFRRELPGIREVAASRDGGSSVGTTLEEPCRLAEVGRVVDRAVPGDPLNTGVLSDGRAQAWAGSTSGVPLPAGPPSAVSCADVVGDGFDLILQEIERVGRSETIERLRRAIDPSGVAAVLVKTDGRFGMIPPAAEIVYRWALRASAEAGLYVDAERDVVDDDGRSVGRLLFLRVGAFSVRCFAECDAVRILGLFRRVFHAERSRAHLDWKYLRNPFAPPKISVAVSRSGALAGQYAGYPVPYVRVLPDGGKARFCSLQVGDTMTEPAFRDVGVRGTKILMRIVRHFFAAHRSAQLGFYFGFNRDGIQRFSAKVIGGDIIEDVPYWVASKQRVEHAVAAAAAVSDGAPTATCDLRVTTVDDPGPELDAFFERVYRAYGLLAERGQSYLRWRYFERPDATYVMLRADSARGLQGWGVFHRQDDTLAWVDALFVPESATRVAQALVAGALEEASLAPVTQLDAWFPGRLDFVAAAVASVGLRRAVHPDQLAMLWLGELVAGADIMRREFYYTMGDSDLV